MKTNILILVFWLVLIVNHNAHAQGCSDAGFCTLNSIQPAMEDTIDHAKYNHFKFGISNGVADNDISIFSSHLEYHRQLNKYLGFNIKVTFLAQSGNDISANGLSDVFINGTYSVNETMQLIAGAKIPLTDGNIKKDGLSLPMDYQASLGTVDLILGLGYQYSDLKFVLAMQQPITQNKNEFIATQYPVNSEIQKFQSTNNYRRSGDVLLRLSYPVALNESFILTPSLLPIYHLANDKFTDQNGVEREIEGSNGLTFNGNIYLDYMIDSTNIVEINFGMPFKTRDVRPDGLTRGYVVTLDYKIKF